MSEDWKTAYEEWLGGKQPLFAKDVEPAFRAGYLAQAETVERLRGALAEMFECYEGVWDCAPDGPGEAPYQSKRAQEAEATARQALADLQPKETR